MGSALAYISKFNLAPISVNLGYYVISNVPLFYVIVGSLLIGLVISFLMQLLKNISNAFILRSKKKEIKTSQEEILELTKRVHQLELENEKLKHTDAEISDPNAL
ncbi:MAG: hypothetical protein UX01_C0001G0162 [Candidatus Collierbacteria bacterium GW2011_GWB2_45_17]|uniref:Lipopolysaccharide assembly protein A domain-containing protein n=1 Tax=Candidatus Collierbacteria bacterium GW2011_GWB2_45_17 TaxID=1618388 RepID=A0A837IG87_9BACT|nr:MAG: hypothetical protein UW48_C0001G0158 [Microgenomates group bacterium GW2011_GWC1_44_23]KKT96278.1 MAG: hypothetical protein UW96_C0001G0156 [Candidatus Collierbacteria bacterium GW2011_GWA1_45_15]KKU01318.1 MAG: hypothetical protein UX01_C0001G0162 [Candidatus Collierbacteria bacterium GW2011_GWB2_45_17]